MRGARAGQRGFSLVEALVAAVLAAALLVGLLDAVGSSAALQSRAGAHRDAQALARELIATTDGRDAQGRRGSLDYSLRVQPSLTDPSGITPDGFRLMRVDITITSPELGQGYHLTTERVMK